MKMFGNVMNRLMDGAQSYEPKVGDGATELCWSDRNPFTIVEVISPTKVVVQKDDYKRADKNGMSETQNWVYSPNPEAHKQVVTKRKDGRWVVQGQAARGGQAFRMGHREKYHDFGF